MDKEEILEKAEIEKLDPRCQYVFKFEEDIPSKDLEKLIDMMKDVGIHKNILIVNSDFKVIEVENNDADN